MKKLWYAVMVDRDDTDWGYGSFDKAEAMRMMHELNQEFSANGMGEPSYIAVIDENYDDEYNATSDAICIAEITE